MPPSELGYLPRLLLVSEATLNADHIGAGRTLLNLLEDYPIDQLLLHTPRNYIKQYPPSPKYAQRVVPFTSDFLRTPRNRIGAVLQPLLNSINWKVTDLLPVSGLAEINKFFPEVALICPVTPSCLLEGYKLSRSLSCPYLIYFMDDWLAHTDTDWMAKGLKRTATHLLRKAAGWLVISDSLKNTLAERYGCEPRKYVVLHNPAPRMDNPHRPDSPGTTNFRVAYAGSIWPMHYDALAAVAIAVQMLRHEGHQIELMIYTPNEFWEIHRKEFSSREVVCGGFVPPDKIMAALQQANLLLVTTSFSQESAHMVRHSVLTKLTDYMVTGRAIFACGPKYSASNEFIRKWDCGFVCESSRPKDIKGRLAALIRDPDLLRTTAEHAYRVARQEFDVHKVRKTLHSFLRNAADISEGVPVQV